MPKVRRSVTLSEETMKWINEQIEKVQRCFTRFRICNLPIDERERLGYCGETKQPPQEINYKQISYTGGGTMSKRHVLIALIILFNVLVSLGFISSNIYMWNYLKTEINDKTPAAYIEDIDAFQVSISHPYINNTAINLGPVPTVIPNYPFILFWISIIGNLVLITVALVLRKKSIKTEQLKTIQKSLKYS